MFIEHIQKVRADSWNFEIYSIVITAYTIVFYVTLAWDTNMIFINKTLLKDLFYIKEI
jgi:hypothetical protein